MGKAHKIKMPKKAKRESQKLRKKKVSTADISQENPLANTVINIVDPGESGIDITDEIRKKEASARKAVKAPNILSNEAETFVDSKEAVEAIRKKIQGIDITDEIRKKEAFERKAVKDPNILSTEGETFVESAETFQTIRNQLHGDVIASKIDEFTITSQKSEKSNTDESLEIMTTPSMTISDTALISESKEFLSLPDSEVSDSLAVNVSSSMIDNVSFSRQTTVESSRSSSFSYFSDIDSVHRVETLNENFKNDYSTATEVSLSTATLVDAEENVDTATNKASDDGGKDKKKRSHISPKPKDEEDKFLQDLKNDIVDTEEDNSMIQEEKNISLDANETVPDDKMETSNDRSQEQKKRSHVSPKQTNDADDFLQELKDDIV